MLVGYGADAICPYMVFEIAQMLREENVIDINDQIAYENYAAAVDRGISKVNFQIIMSLATKELEASPYINFEIPQILRGKYLLFHVNGETGSIRGQLCRSS